MAFSNLFRWDHLNRRRFIQLAAISSSGPAAKGQKPEKPRVSGSDGAEMVYVPAGWFLQGSKPEESVDPDETPQRKVYLDAFWIDKTEVTNQQYRKFVLATGYRTPLYWVDGKIPAGQDNYPVVGVSWEDALAYALWAGKDLPTEAQWEKAARGTDGARFAWGNEVDPKRANISGKLAPVGSHPRDVSPYGCLDMGGNAWEWCRDWYNMYVHYNELPDHNPTGVEEWRRYWYRGTHYPVMRGGYYVDRLVNRITDRLGAVPPETRYWAIGFRCAAAEVPQRPKSNFRRTTSPPRVIKAPVEAVRPRTGRLAPARLPSFEVLVDHPVMVAQSKGFENGDIGWYQYIGYFERLRDGTLFVSFGMHPDAYGPYPPIDNAELGTGAIRISRDDGKTWIKSEPPMPLDGKVLADGRVLSVAQWGIPGSGMVRISEDNGKTIARSHKMELDLTGIDFNVDTIHMSAAGKVQLPSGEILAVGGCTAKLKDWWRDILLRSTDGGLSWRYVTTIMGKSKPNHSGFTEECDLEICPNGDLLAVTRTHAEKPLRHMVQIRSSDGGKTWSEPTPCPGISGVLWPNHSGNVSPSLKNLNNGVMALAYGRPAALVVAFGTGEDSAHWEALTLIGSVREGLLEQHYGLMSTNDITIAGNPGAETAHSSHMPRILVTGAGSFLLAYDIQNYSPFVVEDSVNLDLRAPDPDYPARNSVFVIPITVRRLS